MRGLFQDDMEDGEEHHPGTPSRQTSKLTAEQRDAANKLAHLNREKSKVTRELQMAQVLQDTNPEKAQTILDCNQRIQQIEAEKTALLTGENAV